MVLEIENSMYVFLFKNKNFANENRSEGPARSFPSPRYHRQHRLVDLTQRSSCSIDVDQNRAPANRYPAWAYCLNIEVQARTRAVLASGRTKLCPETTTSTAHLLYRVGHPCCSRQRREANCIGMGRKHARGYVRSFHTDTQGCSLSPEISISTIITSIGQRFTVPSNSSDVDASRPSFA